MYIYYIELKFIKKVIKLKRIFIKIILLITLIVSSFCTSAYGQTYPDVQDPSYSTAIDVLSTYKIISGYPDGNFKPDNSITRAEAAKIATVVIGYDEYTKGMTTDFIDMQGHWAERYIEIINALKIIEGYQDKTFRPGNYITYTDAVTMVIRMLGYTDESLDNDYPHSYYKKAESLGITDGVNTESFYITRKDLCKLIYNSLFCDTVDIKSTNRIEKTGRKLINNIGNMKTEKIDTNFASDHLYMDLNDYLLNTWDVFYDLNEKIVLITNPRYKEMKGYVRTALSANVIFVTDSYGNTKLLDITDAKKIFNGASTYIEYNDLQDSTVRVIFEGNINDGDITGIVAKKATRTFIMDKENLYKPGSYMFAGTYLPLKGNKVDFNRVHLDNTVKTLSDIKVDDVVYLYETNEKNFDKTSLELDVVREKVVGTLDNVKNMNYQTTYTIDNKIYNKSKNYVETENVSVNDTVEAVLDKEDNIVKFNIQKYGKVPETYGLVLQSINGSSLPKAKLLSPQGKVLSFELKENCGAVTTKQNDSDTSYTSNLTNGEFVKYDLLDNNTIKIIEKESSSYLKSYYDEKTRVLTSYGYIIDNNTFMIYKDGTHYKIITPDSLGNYVEGKAVISNTGRIEAFVVDYGLKSETQTTPTLPDTTTKPPVNSYTGTLYGVISSVVEKNNSEYVKLYTRSETFTLSSALNTKASYFKNQFIKLGVKNNVITSITGVPAETSKSSVTGVYTNQIQINDLTYIQYDNNVRVYICTADSNGNITSMKNASISDVKVDSTVQFYDINNTFDGVIDTIIIYN